jgi:hypothetical protein
MILWRPVGLVEMGLVFASGMQRFPPRLPEQPIFYPVLAQSYAAEIAAGWNVRDSPHARYVLRFEIDDAYATKFPVQVVGASIHRELWVAAEQLEEFNEHLLGPITAEEAFFGSQFDGEVPDDFLLAGKHATEQIRALVAIRAYSLMDFTLELSASAHAVFLNYPFWKAAGASRLAIDPGEYASSLSALREAWARHPRPVPIIERATAG